MDVDRKLDARSQKGMRVGEGKSCRHLRQSSLVRCGQYSLICDPPSVLKRFTTAFSLAVGFAMSSKSSSPLYGQALPSLTRIQMPAEATGLV